MDEAGRVVIGRVARAHALAGAIRVRPEGPTAGQLAPGDRVEVLAPGDPPRHLTVAERGGDAASPILRFEEIGDRAGAEALRDALLRVSADDLAAGLEPDTFFVRDLVGCEVIAGERSLGRVVDVLPGTANDNLEVARDGASILIPFTSDALTGMSLEGRWLRIRPDLLGPEGAHAD